MNASVKKIAHCDPAAWALVNSDVVRSTAKNCHYTDRQQKVRRTAGEKTVLSCMKWKGSQCADECKEAGDEIIHGLTRP